MTVTITREFADGDRYLYDNLLCPRGWAQLDTDSDASWYGTWADPVGLVVFTFCEGDCTTTTCTTEAEFIAEVRKVATWHRQHGRWLGIDYGLHPGARDRWEALGLADLFAADPLPA